MTTIIVVVIVALVFFVAVCVVSFMIWKRESEMRTDSIKAIEENLEKLTSGLSSDAHMNDKENFEYIERRNDAAYAVHEAMIEREFSKSKTDKRGDPFEWVRDADYSFGSDEENSAAEITEQPAEKESSNAENPDNIKIETNDISAEAPVESSCSYDDNIKTECEINLDFIDKMNTEDSDRESRKHMGYDTGRSGKKYTTSELETLIKE